jgi:hypothetical protein
MILEENFFFIKFIFFINTFFSENEIGDEGAAILF